MPPTPKCVDRFLVQIREGDGAEREGLALEAGASAQGDGASREDGACQVRGRTSTCSTGDDPDHVGGLRSVDQYDAASGGGIEGRVGLALIAEFELTVSMILKVRKARVLVSDNDVLSAAITLRNPYVDVLSVLQISQLARKRKLTREKRENLEEVESILATTVSGIAQGLRNTG